MKEKAINIDLEIFEKIIKIPEIYPFEIEGKDFIIGYDKFLANYLPISIQIKWLVIITPSGEKLPM